MSDIFYILLILIFSISSLVLVAYSILETRMQAEYQIKENLKLDNLPLRLFKMLRFLGINSNQYFHDVPVEKISTQIRNCKACPNTTECDQQMENSEHVESLQFCPNIHQFANYYRHHTKE